MLTEGTHRFISLATERRNRKCMYICKELGDSADSSQKQPVKGCSAYWKCSGVISPGQSISVCRWLSWQTALSHAHQTSAEREGERRLWFSSSLLWAQFDQPVPQVIWTLWHVQRAIRNL